MRHPVIGHAGQGTGSTISRSPVILSAAKDPSPPSFPTTAVQDGSCGSSASGLRMTCGEGFRRSKGNTQHKKRTRPLPYPLPERSPARRAGGASCAAQAFCPQGKTLAQGQFICPEHVKFRRVEPPAGRRNPKRPPRKSNRSPAQRVRFGEEEQQNERTLTFSKSQSKGYGACSDEEQVTRLELAIEPHKSAAFVGTPHLRIAKNAATPHFCGGGSEFSPKDSYFSSYRPAGPAARHAPHKRFVRRAKPWRRGNSLAPST